MNYAPRSHHHILLALLFAATACTSEEGDLEKHAKACESRCEQAQAECSENPDFVDPWQLACEVACNLDFNDDSRPLEACMDAASTCEETDACVSAGPPLPDDGADTEADDGDDDDSTTSTTSPTTDPTTASTDPTDPTDGESSGGFEGPPCCDTSGTACLDPDVLECTCGHLPSCCTGAWGEVCASIAVANGCIDEGCPTLEGWDEWNCTCSTIDVFCPDDPFVGQIIFATDACGLSEGDALAIAQEACEQGDGECEIGLGSCDCSCSNFGRSCGPSE